MADPSIYTVSYDFGDFQTESPHLPMPATRLDTEFVNIEDALGSVRSALMDVRRSDGALANGIVTYDAFDAEMKVLLQGDRATLVSGDLDPTAFADEAAAVAGAATDKIMTPLRTAQAVAAHPDVTALLAFSTSFATEAQALAGTDTAALMSPLRVAQAIAALAGAPAIRTFATKADLQAENFGATVPSIVYFEIPTAGPGESALRAYRNVASVPAHTGYVTSADGEVWELIGPLVTPRDFGAAWDAVYRADPTDNSGFTDDGDAIRAFCTYLRATKAAGYLPAGGGYTTKTIYGGGCRIIGMGATHATAQTAVSQSWIKGAGTANPILDQSYGAAGYTQFGMTDWDAFTIRGSGDTTVTAVATWARASWSYQIGVELGRSIRSVQTTAGGETGASGGAGDLRIGRLAVEDCGGAGVYAYKFWGLSSIAHLFCRRCGTVAARDVDNREGAAFVSASVSVDYRVGALHVYNNGHYNAALDGLGTGLRVGDKKTVVEGLGRLWDIGGNVVFGETQFEGVAVPLDLYACRSLHIGYAAFTGGDLYIGYGPNPNNDFHFTAGVLRTFDDAEVNIQSGNVDLGTYLHQAAASTTTLTYYADFRANFLNAEAGRANNTSNIVFNPVGDATAVKGGKGSDEFLPFIHTGNETGSAWMNRAPRFSDGTSLENWTWDSVGTISTNVKHEINLRGGAEIYRDFTGLTVGDLYTLQVTARIPGSVNLADLRFMVENGSGTSLISKPFGQSTATKVYNKRMAHVVVPASGTLRVYLRGSSANNTFFGVDLVRGLWNGKGAGPFGAWCTPGEMVAGA